MPEVKFCGMTRAVDVATAVDLGVEYVGVVFASSPRQVNADQARRVLRPATRGRVRRVGVFGDGDPARILDTAEEVGLDVIQLHVDLGRASFGALREAFAGDVWAVMRVAAGGLRASQRDGFDVAAGVVLDAYSAGGLGGTGTPFEWASVADALRELRGSTPIILAGGLRADNVALAMAVLGPDILDVSSGIERAPGVKDPARMRAFLAAVRERAPR